MSIPMSTPKPNAGILDIKPYVGGEGRVSGAMRAVRLASNENPFGCSAQAKAAYLAAAEDLHRYPAGDVADLRAALGRAESLDPARIVCGNGSEELIALITRCYAGIGDEVVHSAHGFLLYKLCAMAVGATPVAAAEKKLRTDVDSMVAAVTEKTKIVFVANPNNPTGSWLTRDELADLHSRLPPHVLLVVDSAYAEFVGDDGYDDGRTLAAAHENVVVLRTFSKVHGLAALRVGWGYFPPAVADVLSRVRGVFNINAPAQAAAVAALEDTGFVRHTVDVTVAERDNLGAALGAMGVTVAPSVCNFVLCHFGADAEGVRLRLRDKGVFVRQMGAYGLPEHLRISIGTPEENTLLLAALRGALA